MASFLVVLDVDSTLIENEVIELLADQAGSLREVEEITFRAMNGEIDFEESLRARVATLAGLPESVFGSVAKFVTVTTGVPEMIAGIKRAGGRVAVVSGGFHEVLDLLRRIRVEEGHRRAGIAARIVTRHGHRKAVVPALVGEGPGRRDVREWRLAAAGLDRKSVG